MSIINKETEEQWQKKKNEWREDIEKVKIPEEVQGKIPILESKLDTLYTQASWEYTRYKAKLNKTNSVIGEVKKLNKKGSNVDRREANAIKAVKNHESGVNLLEYKRALKERVDFFENYVLKVLDDKSRRLSTNVGALKVDAQLTPH